MAKEVNSSRYVKAHYAINGRFTKRITHKHERREGKRLLNLLIQDTPLIPPSPHKPREEMSVKGDTF